MNKLFLKKLKIVDPEFQQRYDTVFKQTVGFLTKLKLNILRAYFYDLLKCF